MGSAQSTSPASGHSIPKPSGATGILTSIGEVVYEWTLDDDRLRWGGNVTDVFGSAAGAAIATGKAYATWLAPDTLTTPFDTVANSASSDPGDGVPYQIEYGLTIPGPQEDRSVWVEDTGRWFAGPDGRANRAHGVVRVVSRRYEDQQKTAYASRFDEVTGQMNRIRLIETLSDAIATAQRQRGHCAFLVLSIDTLGAINEAYGFDIADEIIASVAERIKGRLRAGDALGRFSGNKFGVVLTRCNRDDIDIAAGRFLSAVGDEVITTGVGHVAVTLSIGGVCAPLHAGNAHDAIHCAMEALDMARMAGRQSFVCYVPSSHRSVERRNNANLSTEIVSALNDRRLRLAYQPVATARDGTVAFHECLMRLERADGCIMPAADLMPVAEKLGLARLVDHRVLDLVLEDLAAYPDARIAINVSPQSAIESDWQDLLAAGLRRSGETIADRLTVEITETGAFGNLDDTRRFARRIRDLGVKLAIDDFGSGVTSLQALHGLDLDLVKIDGACVRDLSEPDADRRFVQSLIDLARSFGIATVAEWVSDEATASLLRDMGIDYLQGDHVGVVDLSPPWRADATDRSAA